MPRMAGIGQRNTFDHPASWSSAAQLGMGRTMSNESSKNLSNFPSSVDKRGFSGSNTAQVLSSLSSGVSFPYASRTSSANRSKGFASIGDSMRSNHYPEANVDSGPMILPFYPLRGFSEPPLFSELGNTSHTINDLSNLVTGLKINSKASPPVNTLTSTGKSPSSGSSGFFSGSTNTGSNNLLNPCVSSPGLTFDPSEFPPIINSIGRSQNQSFSSIASHRNYVFAISKGNNSSMNTSASQSAFSPGSVHPLPEFSIDQDFPALTAAQSTALSTVATIATPPMPLSLVSSSMNSQTFGSNVKGLPTQRLHSIQNLNSSYAGATSGAPLQFLNDNFVANIPKNMICDQFGMIGLLKLIKIGNFDSTFNMLAPGLELTSLGVTNSKRLGELYTSFVSPCHDSCMGRPQDMDFAVPPEYLIRHLVADRLPDPPLDQLSEDTLFWLFYNCCREEVQLVTAKELYRREWRFDKRQLFWLTRVPDTEFSSDKMSEYGVYHCWDARAAKKTRKEMKINYADLDNAPDTFRLSSNTLSASVSFISTSVPMVYSSQHQAQVLPSAGHSVSQSLANGNSQAASLPIGSLTSLSHQASTHFPPMSLLSAVSGGSAGGSVCRPGSGSVSAGNGSHVSRSQTPNALVNKTAGTVACASNNLVNGPGFVSQQSANIISLTDKKSQQQQQLDNIVSNSITNPSLIPSDNIGVSSSQQATTVSS